MGAQIAIKSAADMLEAHDYMWETTDDNNLCSLVGEEDLMC